MTRRSKTFVYKRLQCSSIAFKQPTTVRIFKRSATRMSGHSGPSLNPLIEEDSPSLATVPELVKRFSVSKLSERPGDPPAPRMSSGTPAPSANSHHRPWQDSLHTVSKALSFLLATGIHSDVTFVVGREGKQFKVHRLILSMRSPVFEDLLIANPADSGGVVVLKEDSPGAFNWLLNHIYSDRTDLDSIDNALLVLGLADKYMIASAYDTSMRYLQTIVKRNNVLKIYQHLVHLFSDNDSLRGLCRRIFTDNGNAVLISSSLLDLTPEAMTQLLQEPLRVTSETVILKALVSWGQAQLKLQGKQLTPSNLREQVEPFLSEIRFLTMTSDEFVQNVVTSDILTPDETVYVLKNIAKPGEVAPASSVNSITINTSRVNRSSLITKLDIRKEDPRANVLASVETVGNNLAFKNPVHLREGITYVFTLKVKDPQTSLYGCRYSKQTYEADGFIITLSSGVFIQAVVFI
ncbi:BTB/POZ domain-containing protein 6-like isoform X1 [Macrobrachium rosenbergii]|uniref:BTB/POZ domain-containing protein 6-like isoform X1 n=2 Tax=Macrobrachium rosenbergii TaxID=79674 RepID=UPI0034D7AC83